MRDDRERLRDILEAMDNIEFEAAKGRRRFEDDRLIQTWIIHHLQIVGEAASKVSPALRATCPQVPWAQVVAMRNVLVHEYFGVDLDEVWTAVERDLPELRTELESVLRALEAAQQP